MTAILRREFFLISLQVTRTAFYIPSHESSQLNTIFHTIQGVNENPSKEEYLPFLTVVSNNFEKDLPLVKNMLAASEKMTRAENGFKLSERAEMAAGWWFYDIFIFLSPVTFYKSCSNN
jgi:hypothetical protein